MAISATVTIHHTCVWEDHENPMQQGDIHRHFTDQLDPGSVIAITAFPLSDDGGGSSDTSLQVENVIARTVTIGLEPSHSVHFDLRNVGNGPIARYRLNCARIAPAGPFQPGLCSEGGSGEEG